MRIQEIGRPVAPGSVRSDGARWGVVAVLVTAAVVYGALAAGLS